MDDRAALHALATALGIHTHFVDGLGHAVTVSDATLLRICTTMGVPVAQLGDCPLAWIGYQSRQEPELPPVLVAWDGRWQAPRPDLLPPGSEIVLEDGTTITLDDHGRDEALTLPLGYHRLLVQGGAHRTVHTIIAAPMRAFQHPTLQGAWGAGIQLSALRSARSRALGDLRDLETLGEWVGRHGGRVVTMLPLLPTFNTEPVEPSPYSAVSRLFWSELVLDLGAQHQACGPVDQLDVRRGHEEVWRAVNSMGGTCVTADAELEAYSRFRAAQARWGRNWRDWPQAAHVGDLQQIEHDDPVARFHRCAQLMARDQLHHASLRLAELGVVLGLDLTVGVHPDGYDAWSRQELFAIDASVGAPPDPGFPSGQDWGFNPLLPGASRAESHQYFAASLRHQMRVAGVLRVDHIMALARLYWIPHGMSLHEGTYVSYPMDEMLAVLTLESHRHQCEIIGENLGTVPAEVNAALERHGIRGLYLALYQATKGDNSESPGGNDVAMIGSHDTPTFAGWLAGEDIEDRVRHGLLTPDGAATEIGTRSSAVAGLSQLLGIGDGSEPQELLLRLLGWLGASDAAMVITWIEDFWLEQVGVNLPGTPASVRANWQRPMRFTLDEMMAQSSVLTCLDVLNSARGGSQGADAGRSA